MRGNSLNKHLNKHQCEPPQDRYTQGGRYEVDGEVDGSSINATQPPLLLRPLSCLCDNSQQPGAGGTPFGDYDRALSHATRVWAKRQSPGSIGPPDNFGWASSMSNTAEPPAQPGRSGLPVAQLRPHGKRALRRICATAADVLQCASAVVPAQNCELSGKLEDFPARSPYRRTA